MWVNKECCLSDQWGWKWCWRQTLDIALCWAHEGVLCWENVSSITKIPLENHKSCFCQVLRAMEMNIILFYYVKPFSNCTVQYFSLELWDGFARPHWCMIKSLSFELSLFSTIIPVSILPPYSSWRKHCVPYVPTWDGTRFPHEPTQVDIGHQFTSINGVTTSHLLSFQVDLHPLLLLRGILFPFLFLFRVMFSPS